MSNSQWRPDGRGVLSGGECGGDLQRGDSYAVRFVRPDKPGSLVTVIFYAREIDRAPGEFAVARQVEWLTCRDPADPGGTETWSDVADSDVNEVIIDSAPEAEELALQFARAELGNAPDCGWDGEPDYGTAWQWRAWR